MDEGGYIEANSREEFKGLPIEVYLRMLGLSSGKERPVLQELPNSFIIPVPFLGDITTSVEYVRKDGCERSQSIHWSFNKLVPSKVVKGTEHEVDLGVAEISGMIFSRLPSIIAYHVHPAGEFISAKDVVLFTEMGTPLIGLVPSVTTEDSFEVEALLATRESLRGKTGIISRKKDRDKLEEELKQKGFEKRNSGWKKSSILSEYGLGYYHWVPSSNLGRTREGLLEDQGLRLFRIPTKI